ncbi:MAG: hypothetical protein Q4A79_01385 [Candidatus Saccharibacteria bacterium]|nr:hypothetical protein [Candidatus Saccharibacteria bacterium]
METSGQGGNQSLGDGGHSRYGNGSIETMSIEQAFLSASGGGFSSVVMPSRSQNGNEAMAKKGAKSKAGQVSANSTSEPLKAAEPVPGSIGSMISMPPLNNGETTLGEQSGAYSSPSTVINMESRFGNKKDTKISKTTLIILVASVGVALAILAVIIAM